ncbi:hypothetical protein GCM10010149_40690 [Nonomuraea roseoviolacea subsp. roseoviolacea]|uniref:toxin glutamine deamidase domain-containing protein n=1 Tax=Nonomuraea roseoviolacea TaxID=103837 RepID=UPI0031DB03B0
MTRDRKSRARWVLSEGRYDPVVGDGVRWRDYERAAAPTPTDPGPPDPAAPDPRSPALAVLLGERSPDDLLPDAPAAFSPARLEADALPAHPPASPPAGCATPGDGRAGDLAGRAPWEFPAPDPTRDRTRDATSHLVGAPPSGAAPDKASAIARDDAHNTSAGPGQGDLRGTTPDATRGDSHVPALDAMRGDARATALDAMRGGLRGTTPDAMRGGVRDTSSDATWGGSRGPSPDTMRSGVHDAAPDVLRGDVRDATSGTTRGDVRDATSGTTRGDIRGTATDGVRAAAWAAPGHRPPTGPAGWAAAAGGDPGRPVAAPDWFDGPARPPRLSDCRPYGAAGGLARPDPQVEHDLRRAVPPSTRFPDPRGTWVRLINGGGPADDPFRASNAADCALAVLSTWHGEPAAAAPRHPEYDRLGRPVLTGETGGAARIERWVGHRFEYAGHGRHAYPLVARRLIEAGHGAAAIIVVRWPGGGSHAWNAVNFGGEVIWIDAQRGHMAVDPPYTTVTGVFCVIVDRYGRPR